MYDNPGKSLKDFVSVIVVIQIIVYIISGISMMVRAYSQDESVLLGLLVAAIGCLTAWISGLLLAAIGDIAENVKRIDTSMANRNSSGILQGGISSDATSNTAPGWICHTCKTKNPFTSSHCAKCDTSRVVSEKMDIR